MDLGVAKLQEASVALTKDGHFAGSLLYASPEQLEKSDVGPRSDLYALGVLLYELATGGNPFAARGTASVIQAHLDMVGGAGAGAAHAARAPAAHPRPPRDRPVRP